jgi:hypothetical protein
MNRQLIYTVILWEYVCREEKAGDTNFLFVQGQQNKSKQVAGRLDREITGVASAPFQSFVALSGKRKDTGQRASAFA